MQNRKVPMRKCTGCGEMKNKRELVRVVKNKEGEVSLDLTGKKAGRGHRKHPVMIQRLQDTRRRGDPLNGIRSPKHFVYDTEKRFLSVTFIQNSFQRPDFNNKVTFAAGKVVPQSHGSHHLEKRSPVGSCRAGKYGLGQNTVQGDIFQKSGLTGSVGACYKDSVFSCNAVCHRFADQRMIKVFHTEFNMARRPFCKIWPAPLRQHLPERRHRDQSVQFSQTVQYAHDLF